MPASLNAIPSNASSPTSGRLPTFIVIGTMKGGTTSLYRYLAAHPQICMSSVKETNFFAHEHERGIAWYQSLYCRNALQYGEASPAYTKEGPQSCIAERMYASVPQARLIYLLRDPVERMVSNYWHNVAMDREPKDLAGALTTPCEENAYLRTSCYWQQLTPYLRRFDRSQIMLLSTEELRCDAAGVMRRLFAFIGVDPDFRTPIFDEVHHRTVDKLAARSPWRMRLRRWWIDWFERPYAQLLRPLSRAKRPPSYLQKLDARLKAELIDSLRPDIEALRNFSGQDFAEWCVQLGRSPVRVVLQGDHLTKTCGARNLPYPAPCGCGLQLPQPYCILFSARNCL